VANGCFDMYLPRGVRSVPATEGLTLQVGIYGRIDDRQQAHLLALEPQSAWASRARRPEFPNQRILGAARYLAETRNFDGTVVFIFQPAEEGLGGARAMLADGLFERFPCDEIYALHNAPEGPQGQISVHSGP